MGTLGAGNFENDGALDFVGGYIKELSDRVVACFADGNSGLDEGGEAELMPCIALIKLMAEHCGAAPPKPAVIQTWHTNYLGVYDAGIDDLDPTPEFKIERRAEIDKTFTELTQLSRKFWKT